MHIQVTQWKRNEMGKQAEARVYLAGLFSHRTLCVGFHLSCGNSPLIVSSPGGCKIEIHSSPSYTERDGKRGELSHFNGQLLTFTYRVHIRVKNCREEPEFWRRVWIVDWELQFSLHTHIHTEKQTQSQIRLHSQLATRYRSVRVRYTTPVSFRH